VLLQIVEFDVVEMGNHYDNWLRFDSEEAKPLFFSFGMIGFRTPYFLYNIGSMLIILATIPLFMMI
jgi:hypothetical protein